MSIAFTQGTWLKNSRAVSDWDGSNGTLADFYECASINRFSNLKRSLSFTARLAGQCLMQGTVGCRSLHGQVDTAAGSGQEWCPITTVGVQRFG